mmetsp:Transcript_77764/g.126160  ORF Transcript_77764/g.126160 Transcript_77764/m.126160 type:complete len:231 (-) Transcript_77764:509-1201(-)
MSNIMANCCVHDGCAPLGWFAGTQIILQPPEIRAKPHVFILRFPLVSNNRTYALARVLNHHFSFINRLLCKDAIPLYARSPEYQPLALVVLHPSKSRAIIKGLVILRRDQPHKKLLGMMGKLGPLRESHDFSRRSASTALFVRGQLWRPYRACEDFALATRCLNLDQACYLVRKAFLIQYVVPLYLHLQRILHEFAPHAQKRWLARLIEIQFQNGARGVVRLKFGRVANM